MMHARRDTIKSEFITGGNLRLNTSDVGRGVSICESRLELNAALGDEGIRNSC